MAILGNKFLVWLVVLITISTVVIATDPDPLIEIRLYSNGEVVQVWCYDGGLKYGGRYRVKISGNQPTFEVSRVEFGNSDWYKGAFIFDPPVSIGTGFDGYVEFQRISGDDGTWCWPLGYWRVVATYSMSSNTDFWGVQIAGSGSTCMDYPVIPPEKYSLGLSVPTGGGSILNVNEGREIISEILEYEEGTQVDLAAIPDLGWSFHSWLIDGSATSTYETIRITMDDDHVVEARFTDNLNPVDPDNPSHEIKRSELWGSYEKDSDDDYWKEWTLKGSNIADIIESGGVYGVYYGDHLVGYMEEDETVHILMPFIDERFWISKGGQCIGYIDGSSIYIGNRTFGHLVGSINVDGSGTFLGQAAEITFSNKKYGTIKFYDEYGEVMINISDRFWEGYWIPDDPLYDPEDPETYPDEPEWKNIPDEPDEPGIFDEIFQDIKRFIAGFIREYFFPSQDLLEFHASELKRKASDKFPFNLFWIPEKLQGEYEDVDIPLLDLSMFGVDDFKVDWFNNEYMEQAAEWMRNFSRYILWFMFILWLRDNITPTLVID